MSTLPPNVYPDTPGTRRPLLKTKRVWSSCPGTESPCARLSPFVSEDKRDLPYLISKFGSASATAWLEQRYSIWRGKDSTEKNPQVQGYLAANKFVFCWGNPLTVQTKEAMKTMAEELMKWAKGEKKRVVWCCVDTMFSEVLADGINGVGWGSLTCIREDVLHPAAVKLNNKDVRQNLRRADKSSVSIDEMRLWSPTFLPDPKTKKQIEDGLEAWKNGRKGRQIASASLLPWLDASNRRYFVARTPHELVAICILTPIAHDSYQIKNSVTFPNAPKGTSEALLAHVIKEMKDEGKNSLTFGTSALNDIRAERNIGGWKINLLSKSYRVIIKRTGLAKRGQFRTKFETEGDELHVCFPPGGFGFSGLVALMKMLRA